MASVQERLQQKRMPLVENWSISERLYLASAVACSGDQNWMSVSRSLKMLCGNNRPSDWFSQRKCAAQYGKLLENVEPTKRKKRNEKDTSQTIVETPIELIVRKLTQDRITELNKLIQDEREEFQTIRNEINGIQSNVYDENQLRQMLQQIENEEKQRDLEKQKYAQWLKEREEQNREMEKAWTNRPQHQSPTANIHSPSLSPMSQKIKVEEMEVDDPNAKQGTSPLLTSLLKSPSAAPNPSPSMLHNMPNQQARVTAPTITNLLTGTVTNLSSSLAAAQATGAKVNNPSVAPTFPTGMHNQPLTGPPPNEHGFGNMTQSPSQAAPTLSMLLENKQKENFMKIPPLTRIDSQNSMCQMEQSSDIAAKTEPTDSDFNSAESPIKDDDQQLMDVFGGLIPEDMTELADIDLDDLIDADPVASGHPSENLDTQVNLDLKTFQSPPRHSAETIVVKEEISSVSENTVDSTNARMDAAFDELKESKNTTPVKIQEEKKLSTDFEKDDDSDLSNDTPLAELIKQETSAKLKHDQLQSPQPTPTDELTEVQEQPEAQLEPTKPIEEDNIIVLEECKIEDADSPGRAVSESEEFSDSAKPEQSQFDLESEEKPSKIEMPIDSFESDSNEEKSMETIKRKIEALPELKDSNSSENSQDEKLADDDIETAYDNSENNSDQPLPERTDDENVDEIGEKAGSETGEQVESTAETVQKEVETIEEKEVHEDVEDLTQDDNDEPATKDDHEIESEQIDDDSETDKPELVENESDDKMNDVEMNDVEMNDVESVGPGEEINTSTEVVEILDDDPLLKDEVLPDNEADMPPEEEIKGELHSLPTETDDLIEIKSDEEKQEPNSPEPERIEDVDKTSSSVTIEIKEIDEKEKSPAPGGDGKVSTDDELYEDAKETLEVEVEVEVKPKKRVTPAIVCDTDDDAPIEVVKEGKMAAKRDYSRRKKEEKRQEESSNDDGGGSISSRLRLKDRDRSESPFIEEDAGEPLPKNKRRYSTTPVIDSLPCSPASSDDREYRSWKKSIQLLYTSLVQHRFASIFAKPITEDQAPSYRTVILNPMDLQSLKRSLDSGQIRTTMEFKRYIMLMCYNAIFYNVNDEVTCSRAKELMGDALQLIEEFTITWKKDNEKPAATVTPIVTKSVRGRKSNRLMN